MPKAAVGRAVPLVAVQPESSAYLGHLPTNTTASRSFTLTPANAAVKLGAPTVEGCQRLSAALLPAGGPSNRPSYCVNVSLQPCPTAEDVRGSVLVPILFPTNYPPVRLKISARIGSDSKP